MRRPILLDNPPPRPLPSDRWSRFLDSRHLRLGGFVAGGVAVVVGASVVLAMLMPYLVTPDARPRAAASDVGAAAAKPAAASAAGNGLQYVGDVKQPDRPCEEQTWPYIAAQCLKPDSGQASGRKPAAARVAVDRAAIKASRAGMLRPEQVAVAAPAPVAAETAFAQAAAPDTVAPDTAAPMPAARPGPRQAAQDPAAQRKRARSATARAGEPKDIRPDIRAEARRAQASYEVPGPVGDTRRVVVVRPQSVHQAAAFSDER